MPPALTVFVVDDDDTIRDALDLFLTDEGYRVVGAKSASHTLELLRQEPGHAVVLFDYQMPYGDGLDLLQAVAADTALQQRHTFICMAARDRFALPLELQALLQRFHIPFVLKPFSMDDVQRMVDEAHQSLACAMSSHQGENPQATDAG